MSITKVVKLITFIPWILYFIEIMLYRISTIEKYKLDKTKYFDFLNSNLFKAINIKVLVLFCIFIIFLQFKNTTVLEILFPAIYIYLLVDFFHVYASDCAKIKHKSLMVLSVLLLSLLILFFVFTNHLYTTYELMFIISILSAFIMYGFSLTIKKNK